MTKKHHSENLSEQTNDFYKEYYNKPRWWFKYRYDTQYKMKSAINALKNIGFDHKGKKIFEFGFGSGELITTFIGADFISGTEISKFSVFLANNRADNNQTLQLKKPLRYRGDYHNYEYSVLYQFL